MNQPHVLLSHRLRAETKEAHTTAERSGIMRRLLRGTIEQHAYVALLDNLAALYAALETELDRHREHVALVGVDWNALRRLPSLRHDIEALSDSDHVADIKPATLEYAQHVHALGSGDPALLFAHAYLRYLGDLYGGQIIKRIVRDTFGDSAETATTFYDFDDIGAADAFKADFRSAIDRIPSEVVNHDRMVAEAQYGYELHARIFNELAD